MSEPNPLFYKDRLLTRTSTVVIIRHHRFIGQCALRLSQQTTHHCGRLIKETYDDEDNEL
jgi:hypothetical protein